MSKLLPSSLVFLVLGKNKLQNLKYPADVTSGSARSVIYMSKLLPSSLVFLVLIKNKLQKTSLQDLGLK